MTDPFAQPVTALGLGAAPDGRRAALLYLPEGTPCLAVFTVPGGNCRWRASWGASGKKVPAAELDH
jgi:hypothetical protein